MEEKKIIIDGHEAVDLGLSVKWATCNIRAIKLEEYSDYFAWGETEPKEEYTEDNCCTYEKSMGDISGNANYDAARANWGSTWRMPTKMEMEELKNECTWKWIRQNGVRGMKVTGPNGNSIFLPVAGYCYCSSCYCVGEYGGYWGSTPYGSDDNRAYRLNLYSAGVHVGVSWDYRYYGFTVRPVSE